MSGYTSEVVESEKAFEYLRYVKQSDSQIYSTKAAEDFNVKQPRATKVLSDLEDLGVLDSTKDGRKKVYEFSAIGIYRLFWELTLAEIESNHSDLEKPAAENIRDEYGTLKGFNEIEEEFDTVEEVVLYIADDLKEELAVFVNLFVKKYFYNVENSTLKQMLVTDFYRGFSEVKDNTEYPSEFRILDTISKHFTKMLERPGPIVKSALQDIQKSKELDSSASDMIEAAEEKMIDNLPDEVQTESEQEKPEKDKQED